MFLFPWSNFHELNLDWIIKIVTQLIKEWNSVHNEFQELETKYEELLKYVNDRLSEENLSPTLIEIINNMIKNGTFDAILENIITYYVNVNKLGIFGDGTTDYTDKINSAIQTYSALYFPEGEYVISNEIVLKSNLILKGNNAVFKPTMSEESNIQTFVARNCDNIEIDGISVEGGNAGFVFNYYSQYSENKPVENYNKNIHIRNCHINVNYFAIMFLNINGFSVKNVVINNDVNKLNTDGIHMVACVNGVIENCSGHTGDDFISFIADEIYSKNLRHYGEMNTVQVNNCKINNAYRCFDFVSTTTKITNIEINNCELSAANKGNVAFAGDSPTYEADVCFNDCTFVQNSSFAIILGQNNNNIKLSLNGCKFTQNFSQPVIGFDGNLYMNNCEIFGEKSNRIFVNNGGNLYLSFCYLSCGNSFSALTNFKDLFIEGCKIISTNADGRIFNMSGECNGVRINNTQFSKTLIYLLRGASLKILQAFAASGGNYLIRGDSEAVGKTVVTGSATPLVTDAGFKDHVSPRSFEIAMNADITPSNNDEKYCKADGNYRFYRYVNNMKLYTISGTEV